MLLHGTLSSSNLGSSDKTGIAISRFCCCCHCCVQTPEINSYSTGRARLIALTAVGIVDLQLAKSCPRTAWLRDTAFGSIPTWTFDLTCNVFEKVAYLLQICWQRLSGKGKCMTAKPAASQQWPPPLMTHTFSQLRKTAPCIYM